MIPRDRNGETSVFATAPARTPGRRRPRQGFFLVLVLILIVVATMAVYSFTELMVAYDEASYLAGDLVQARINVESGTEITRMVLAQPPSARIDMGGLWNNPSMFRAITVSTGGDGVTPSNFTIVAPGLNEYGQYAGIRFGLQDESARLNVNTLPVLEQNSDALTATLAVASVSEDMDAAGTEALDSENIAVSLLMALPSMTEDVADAILDWVDEDEETRAYGAEFEYYSTLPTPYAPANGPLQSVEELLLVRGVTPTLLFGADSNRNGVLDADEQQRFGVGIDTPGALGWAAYLTVHGAESNKDRYGEARVNVNQADLELLYDDLSAKLGDDLYASFIVAYRIAGQPPTTGLPSAGAGGGDSTGEESDDEEDDSDRGGRGNSDDEDSDEEPPEPWTADLLDALDLTGGGGTNINQVLDLVDAEVTIGSGDDARTYLSPFVADPALMASYMPILMDALSTQDVDVLPGRINLNESPAELLYGIPILEAETVDMILEARQSETDDPNREFATWPLVEGIVSLQQMRLLLPLVTGGGDVYRAQIIGYFEGVGASHRSEVIIDATTVNPKVVSQRDLSHLGRGFDLSVLGVRSQLTP